MTSKEAARLAEWADQFEESMDMVPLAEQERVKADIAALRLAVRALEPWRTTMDGAPRDQIGRAHV
jgi:hypothetical protein